MRLYIPDAPPLHPIGMACMDATRGTAYGLALSQGALSLGTVLYFDASNATVFSARTLYVNGSLTGVSPVHSISR